MAGLLIGPDWATGTIGNGVSFPADHIIYTNTFSFTSTAAASDPGTAWANTSLTLTVPSANAAKCSKLIIIVSNSMNADGATYSRVGTQIYRSAPSTATIAKLWDIGSNFTGNTMPNASLTGTDASLGSGDHTYVVQYANGLNYANYSGSIKYHGDSGSIVSITIMGVV